MLCEAAGVAYLVAGAPFLVAGVALLGLRSAPWRAGAAALVAAVAGALVLPELEPSRLGEAFAGGLTTSARVLYILFGGLLLHRVLAGAGAVARVSEFLGRVEPRREALALLVVLGVAPFFESITGFGLAVVVGAPILMAAGFSPLRAAVLASWGQCAVPWGALGVGTAVGAELSGLSFAELSNVSAMLNLPLFALYGLSALALSGGAPALRRHGLQAASLGLLAGVVTLLVSLFLVPELSGALGAVAVIAVFLASRARTLRRASVPVRALAPYGLVLVLLVVATGPASVRTALESLGPALSGPAPWLYLSAILAALILGVGRAAGVEAVAGTARQWLPVALATVTFVLAGQVVAGSGAAGLLAGGAAAALGGAYPLAAPLFGALGGGLSGSNVGSNALFMPFQVEAAASTDSSRTVLAGVQNVAGSHASFLAPQRVILAATATGLEGREADIVRTAAGPVLATVVLLGVVGLVAA